MSDRLDALLELERRGELPSQYQDALNELRNREQIKSTAPRAIGPGPTASLHDMTMQGLTFGFGDEIAAGARAVADAGVNLVQGQPANIGQAYDQNLADVRAEQERRRQKSPILSTAAEIGGAMFTGAGVGGPIVSGAKAIPGMVGRGGLVGGAEGGVAGTGYSEGGAANRARAAATGAAVGAGIGASVPALVGTVRGVARKVGEKATQQGARDAATRRVLQALERDGLSPEEALAKVDEMGPGAMLADVGKNTTGLAETVAIRPGKALTTVEEAIERRANTQANRILDAFDDAVGPPGREVIEIAERASYFRDALKVRIPLTPRLKQLLQRPTLKEAFRRAQKLAAEQDIELPPLERVMSRDFVEAETTLMHWLKKGLDDVLEPKRDPVTGKVIQQFGKNELNAAKRTRYEFRELVKSLNPAYEEALERAGYGLRIDAAFDRGSSILRPRIKARDIEKMMARMTEQERRAFQRGVLQALEDQVTPRANVGYDVSATALRHQDKLKAVFGSKADDLISRLKVEREIANNNRRMIGNSRTAYRMNAADDFNSEIPALAINAATGNKPGLAAQGFRGAYQWWKRPGEAVGEHVAETLTEMNPEARRQLMTRLLIQGSQRRTFNERTARMAAALAGAPHQ